MPDQPPHSRFRRLPGLYRFGEVKAPDPHEEPQRLTLYLPGRLLDLAQELAIRDGAESVREYCEALLAHALSHEDARHKAEAVEVRHDLMDDLEVLASDPDTVAAWAHGPGAGAEPGPGADRPREVAGLPPVLGAPREAVLRHAGLGEPDDPAGFLATLRRGEPIPPAVRDDLLAALVQLENGLRPATALDRRLAYALHRLAFEGQVLLTDAPGASAADGETVDGLRRVQEAVDRVLSGEDIRYFPEAAP